MGSGICLKHATEIDAQSLIDDYAAAVTLENDIFMWMRRSEFTEKKDVVDRMRGAAYVLGTGMVRLNLKHFDPQIRNAAEHVHNLLSSYGCVYEMGYDAATASLDSVIARLRDETYNSAVEVLGLMSWINELDSLNTRFKTCADNVARENINRPKVSFREARKKSDGTLRLITNRVESLVNINEESMLAAFIEEYNTLVKHYNKVLYERLGRNRARRDISAAVISSVASQPFTGKPVFVIPEVCLRDVASDGSVKVTELVFTDDFMVTYRNNVEPGTATLMIRGAGKYKGKIVTTFNIVVSD